jgi:hypothetical protein
LEKNGNFRGKSFEKLFFPRNSAESDFPLKKMYEKSAPASSCVAPRISVICPLTFSKETEIRQIHFRWLQESHEQVVHVKNASRWAFACPHCNKR